MREIRSLTGLRGYASLWVFFLHAMYGWPEGSFLVKIASLGGAGVIVFFVLSGYILSLTYADRFRDESAGYRNFVIARLARVYPLHLFTLFAFAFLVWLGYLEKMPTDNAYTFILNVLLIQSWGFTDLVSWNQPSWSISTEFFAYLMFPLFIARLTKATFVFLAAVATALACLIYFPIYDLSLKYAGITDGVRQFQFGSSLLSFFWVFAAGCTLYSFARRIRSNALISDLSTFAGLLFLVVSCLTTQSGLSLWQGTIASVLIIFGIRNDTGISAMVFANPIIHFIGRVSFALYLCASSVEWTARHYVNPLPLWANLALSLGVATALHYLVEVPARNAIRGATVARKPQAPVIQSA
ncbi:acyltransferase [Rhizobium sp. AN80A]|uniref:acyltransferase family protein n=1 Tax=Rhizobium sp. AN80A TaxID=3040673 RepID=UPI0024B32901|nr:acyltransferase [Rhizobium sp. AN80A]